MPERFLDYMIADIWKYVIAIGGSVLSLWFEKDRVTVMRIIVSMGAGVVGSLVFNPAFCEWQNITSPKWIGLWSFFFSFSSMSLLQGLFYCLTYMRQNPIKLINAYLKKQFGGTVQVPEDDPKPRS